MPRPPATARWVAALVAAVVRLGAAGCGPQPNDLAPASCLVTNRDYLRALERAPGGVRLASDTAISACLVPEQQAGQLASIGHEMIIAATKLNVEARHDPGGPAAVQLGYLIGAVAKGADPIHTDLVRRLNSAARFSETGGTLPASFERAFGRGYAAGHSSG
ncbi:MAG: hypothetical protein QOD14_2270 [Solirubrobacterales bacterium]|nr:hypothetical protein [Solirubrobacterales bacterium]